MTLWYVFVFVLSATVAFALFYLLILRLISQRTDEDLITNANRLAQVYALEGGEMLRRAALLQVQTTGEQKMFFRLFYPSGVFFSSSNMTYWKNIGIDRKAVDAVLEEGRLFSLVTQPIPRRPYNARIIYKRIGINVVLQLGVSLQNESHLVETFKRTFVITMSVLLLIAVGLGWIMARSALAGVASVTQTAQKISEEDLDTRVPVLHRHDEIDQLAVTFNQMLDRIKQLISGIRQMNDNIAHDLRSPIARIRGLAEVTLTSDGGMEEYAQMAASTIEECDRLLQMINTMLTISRTEAGVDPITLENVDLAKVAREACVLFQPLAEDKQISLHCSADSPCSVRGNEQMLQRLIANLVDNAIKYTDMNGSVWVTVNSADGNVVMEVRDNGPGIPPEDHRRIFQRFFRGDQSRSVGGAGLGLSLAQAIVRAHGGSIILQSMPGQGSTFTIALPRQDSH
ncbi:MAG: ATP-binding protein [Desulfobacteraceae bacterium]|nr:ATP-binding protein [Desulfobacteraceae bacterium]